ncbi:MAG TPA: hypothetical protein VJ202_01925 [Thermodesulfobacteriota bacterium]|nr:hypothetical protein [Thermodesulfobacteriota bacterium]
MKNLLTLFIMLAFISSCSKGNNADTKPVQDKKTVRVVKLNVNMAEEQRLQKASDNGFQPWRNSPVDVAQAALVNAGANVNMADCRLLSEKADEAVVSASNKKGSYKVICKRVVKDGGIWTATEVEVTEDENTDSGAMEHEHMKHEHMGHEPMNHGNH